MCGVEPWPGAAELYLPGLAFASAISSARVLAGNDGLTTRMLGELVTHTMGSKSLMGSYPILVQERVDPMCAAGGEEQGVAIRSRLGHELSADVSTCTPLVQHDDSFFQLLRQLVRQYPARHIRGTAWRKRNDQLDGPGWPIVLRHCATGSAQHCSRAAGRDHGSANHVVSFAP